MIIALSMLEKLLLSIIIGGIIGLEREHTKKQTLLGLRTFSLISLSGMILTELSRDYYYIASSIGLIGIFALAVTFYYNSMHFKHSIGLTTILMLPLTYIMGMLISFDFILEAIAATIIVTYFLIERGEVHHLVEKISRREIVDFLTFAVIAFIIYPLIPTTGYYFLGHEVNVQAFVLAVILISALSFISHIIVRVIKHNAVLYAAFLGGLVSSLATVMLFARDKKVSMDALKLSFTSSSAGSIFRDAVLLFVLNFFLFRSNLFLFVLPFVGYLLLTQYYSKFVKLSHFKFVYERPISLIFVLKFAFVLFLITTITTTLFENYSEPIFLLSLLFGGAVNSASVIASIAFLFSGGVISENIASSGIFLGLLGSALSKLGVASAENARANLKYIIYLIALSLVLATIGFLVAQIFAF